MKPEPKFKIGDICLLEEPGFEDDPDEWKETMIINGKASWYEYKKHPNKGYYQYDIKGKANPCPEDLLKLKA